MKTKVTFHEDILKIGDVEGFVDALSQEIQSNVHGKLRRKGGIVGVSGGIDSSVTMALAVRALGKDQVLALLMPEKDSSPDSLEYAKMLANQFGVDYLVEDITPILDGFRCYPRRDEAVSRIFPEYDPHRHTFKIGMNRSSIETGLPSLFYLTLVDESGREQQKRLPPREYMQIIAASNFKQRTRMSMLYYHAERLHHAVIGTANKHEIHQGFFVKHGDSGVDIMPIGSLYKTQVYQLADFLDIPEEIVRRTPTSDTYSAEQTQEEFFFQLPFQELDLFWYAYEHNYPVHVVAPVMNRSEEAVGNIFQSFRRKQQTTDYLRMAPIMPEK